MNDNPALDARVAANCVLDTAETLGFSITNLALQKLLYFSHGLYLTARQRPLVTGYFEAWAYGPVHPQIYSIFRHAGAGAIRHRARRRDYGTGQELALDQVSDPAILTLISGVVQTLGPLPAGRLVDLSHAKGGPWFQVVNEARTRNGRGIRIHDTVIAERFPRHKLEVGALANGDGPVEESLLTA